MTHHRTKATRSMDRRAIILGVALLATGLLTSCVSPSVRIPPGSRDLHPCPDSDQSLEVSSLQVSTPVDCDLTGQTIEFPGGRSMTVQAIGVDRSVSTTGEPTYGNFNFGLYGIVAWRVTKSGTTTWWGTRQGLKAYWAAFGKKAQYQDIA